jgi:hypothetical protein
VSVGYHHLGELTDPGILRAWELALDGTGHVLMAEAVNGGVSLAALCFCFIHLVHSLANAPGRYLVAVCDWLAEFGFLVCIGFRQ